MSKDLQPINSQSGALASLAPKTLEEALKFCDFLATSTVIPKDFVGKPANIFVAVQWGMEIGLAPLQAMQNIAVINGRPSLWGDAMLALVIASTVFGSIDEFTEGEGDTMRAVCRVSRKGGKIHEQVFSAADAKKAGLLGKDGPWRNYPGRMMQMRARSWALRDTFPDVLKGMPCAEEVTDYEILPEDTKRIGGGKPEVQAPKATQQASQEQQETGKVVDTSEKVTAGGVTLLKRSLDNKNIPHADFCKHMKVAAIEDLLKTDLNPAMEAIKKWEPMP